MGLYLGNLMQGLVKDFLLPAIGLAIPGMNDMATYAVTVMSQVFGVGDFLIALITFIIVASSIPDREGCKEMGHGITRCYRENTRSSTVFSTYPVFFSVSAP
jgi:hypothetical protein